MQSNISYDVEVNNDRDEMLCPGLWKTCTYLTCAELRAFRASLKLPLW